MGVSFAIPIEVAMNTAKQLRESGHVSRGQLGVAIQNVDRTFAKTLGLDRSIGALVSSVTPDSAADKAGVKVGDVILSFNGLEILQSSDLPPMVGNTAPGTKVRLRLLRDGKEREFTAVLGEVPSDDSVAGSGTGGSGKSSSGVLGLVVQTPSAEEREQLGLDAKEGVLISRVVGDAARRAGLREGDVILRVGRTAVASAKAFADAVAEAGNSEAVMLLVRRGEQTQFIAISPPKTE
jgi:serine protease Do